MAGRGQQKVWRRLSPGLAEQTFGLLGTRPNISEFHGEISIRVPFCIKHEDGLVWGRVACLPVGAVGDGQPAVDGEAVDEARRDQQWAVAAKRGITRDYTPFLSILQGMTLPLQGITLPPF